jgi:hypothetical protein
MWDMLDHIQRMRPSLASEIRSSPSVGVNLACELGRPQVAISYEIPVTSATELLAASVDASRSVSHLTLRAL